MVQNTIRIGVCDDEERDLKRIEGALQTGIQGLDVSVNVQICLFSDGGELCAAGQRETFDLLFLDIEMPGINGFQLAKQIYMIDRQVNIIFVSAHESLVFESQEYGPLWFVRKKALEKDCFLALRKYLETVLPEEKFYVHKSAVCLVRDILYMESCGHMLIIRKTNGELLEQYGALKTAETALAGRGFLRTHKSYLVNQRYIEEIGKREIRLTNGTVLEMGRDRRKALLEAMSQYRGRHYGHT